MNTNDFSKAKVGETLHLLCVGDVTVRLVNKYSIVVIQDLNSWTIKLDGKNVWSYQILFWSNPEIIAPARVEPRPDLKIDDKVIVWDDNKLKLNRHFHSWAHDGIRVYLSGESSFTSKSGTAIYRNYEIVTDENKAG